VSAQSYRGPLRGEPFAIELHNTCYASGGEPLDGLADPASAAAWLHAVRDRLPRGGTGREPTAEELIALRRVVRDVLHATIEHRVPARSSIDTLNRAAARAPRSPAARWQRNRPPLPDVRFHRARRADILLSAIAADAIDLITGPARDKLQACGAPGCVLVFLKRHPRREWCSAACGNRARQARHYRRTHRTDAGR
jgi:predicted RNA-binding Zn ribbon-like protein